VISPRARLPSHLGPSELSAAIRAWRESKGWSQSKLGQLVGVIGKIVSAWERGVFRPNAAHLANMIRMGFVLPARPAPSLPWKCSA